MPLGEQRPAVRIPYQPTAVFTTRSYRLVSDQEPITLGSAGRCHRFPRLWASSLSHSRTSFAWKRWQDKPDGRHCLRALLDPTPCT
jgi:hypothetical protein